MEIKRNTVVKLDAFASETPYSFRETGVYGRVDAITPYEVNGKIYDSYTLGTIEENEYGDFKIRPCGYAYYVSAHLVIKVLGQWIPEKRTIE